MKKLLFLLLLTGISFTAFGQKGDAAFFKSLSTQRTVHPSIKEASVGIANNFTIRDSLLYFTQSFESAILKGRSAGAVKPELVRTAQKKYPGTSLKAIQSRLRIYATESEKSGIKKY